MAKRGQLIPSAIFFLLFLSASLLLYSSAYIPITPQLAAVRFTGIGTGAVLIVALALSVRTEVEIVVPWWLLTVWELFAVCCGLSSLLNNSLATDMTELFWLAVCVPVCFFISGVVVVSRFGVLPLLYGLSAAHAVLICFSLIYDPVLRFRALGLFGDPNQLGIATLLAVLLPLVLLPKVLGHLPSSWRALCLISALLVLSFFLICASSHRTSLVIFFVCLVISIGRFDRIRVIALGTLLLIIAGAYITVEVSDQAAQVVTQMINKHATAIGRGQILDGREEIWRFAVYDIQLFGHGRDYFVQNSKLGAHSSFLSILATRGLLAAFMLGVMCLSSLILCWKVTRNRAIPFEASHGPLLIIVTYWLMGLTEGVFGSLGMGIHMAFLIAFGYVASVSKRECQPATVVVRRMQPGRLKTVLHTGRTNSEAVVGTANPVLYRRL